MSKNSAKQRINSLQEWIKINNIKQKIKKEE